MDFPNFPDWRRGTGTPTYEIVYTDDSNSELRGKEDVIEYLKDIMERLDIETDLRCGKFHSAGMRNSNGSG